MNISETVVHVVNEGVLGFGVRLNESTEHELIEFLNDDVLDNYLHHTDIVVYFAYANYYNSITDLEGNVVFSTIGEHILIFN